MRRLTGCVVLVAAVALLAAGCDKQTTTPTTPTAPTVQVTESFSGTLSTNGAATFSFTASATGYVTASIKALSPDSTLRVGLGLGTWNGVTCQVVLANDLAGQGLSVTGSVASAADLCVRIYDIGQVTVPTTFELTVVHP